jgi:chromosome partitioning protein
MGEIITFASAKGGVGKTVTVVNLGMALALLSKKVLILDASPQSGFENMLGLKIYNNPSLLDILINIDDTKKLKPYEENPLFHIVGFGKSNTKAIKKYENAIKNEILKTLLFRLKNLYDYILIDAPPYGTESLEHILKIKSNVIITLSAQSMAVKSLPTILTLIKEQADSNQAMVSLKGILLTMTDYSSRNQRNTINQIKNTLPKEALFKTSIAFNRNFSEQTEYKSYSASQKPMDGYEDLALELI